MIALGRPNIKVPNRKNESPSDSRTEETAKERLHEAKWATMLEHIERVRRESRGVFIVTVPCYRFRQLDGYVEDVVRGKLAACRCLLLVEKAVAD